MTPESQAFTRAAARLALGAVSMLLVPFLILALLGELGTWAGRRLAARDWWFWSHLKD